MPRILHSSLDSFKDASNIHFLTIWPPPSFLLYRMDRQWVCDLDTTSGRCTTACMFVLCPTSASRPVHWSVAADRFVCSKRAAFFTLLLNRCLKLPFPLCFFYWSRAGHHRANRGISSAILTLSLSYNCNVSLRYLIPFTRIARSVPSIRISVTLLCSSCFSPMSSRHSVCNGRRSARPLHVIRT